jgi:hypothetical protein
MLGRRRGSRPASASSTKPGTIKAWPTHSGRPRIMVVSPASRTAAAPAPVRQASSRPKAGHQRRAQGVQQVHAALGQAFGEEVDLHVAVVQVAPGEERRRRKRRAQLQQFDITGHRRREQLAAADGHDGHGTRATNTSVPATAAAWQARASQRPTGPKGRGGVPASSAVSGGSASFTAALGCAASSSVRPPMISSSTSLAPS